MMPDIWEVIQVVQHLVRAVSASPAPTLPMDQVHIDDDEEDSLSPPPSAQSRPLLPPPLSLASRPALDQYKPTQLPPAPPPPSGMQLQQFARVNGTVGDLLVALSQPGSMVLRLQSAVFTQSSEFVGWVIDVFGKIQRPLYTVFNDQKCPELPTGTVLFYCRSQGAVLSREQILVMKATRGSDASYKNDRQARRESRKGSVAQDDSSDDDEHASKRRQRPSFQYPNPSKYLRLQSPAPSPSQTPSVPPPPPPPAMQEQGQIVESGIQGLLSALRESRLTPSQLQQLKHLTLSELLKMNPPK